MRGRGRVPAPWDLRADSLSVESQIWRHAGGRRTSYEASRGGEQEAEAAFGRGDPGQPGAEGASIKNLVMPVVRLEAWLMARDELGLSERRACRLVGIHRSVGRYLSRKEDTPKLVIRLRELASERRRYGYRRLAILLWWEGFLVNPKRVYRWYKEEGHLVTRRRRKKTAGIERVMPPVPERRNQRWSMDFLLDGLVRWSEAEGTDPGRRLHQRMPGHRVGHISSGAQGGAGPGAGEPHEGPSRDHSGGQWARVCREGPGCMGL